MRPGSSAWNVAKGLLNMFDELSKFRGARVSNTRTKEDVIEAIHYFDDPVPVIRRWWTDNAPEFAAAASFIRQSRPLGHYTSIPKRPQSNAIAERNNRTTVEGARTCLIQSGFDDKWYPLAFLFWLMLANALLKDKDGITPYRRRFGEEAPYRCYPFGLLVLFKFSKPSKPGKWDPRLIPYVLVEITSGPGFRWGHCYGGVRLDRFIGRVGRLVRR